MTKKIAAAYMRVSTGQQSGEDKSSLEQQRNSCITCANAQGYSIPENLFFEDVVSGKKESRPAFDVMLEAASRQEFEKLYVLSIDRYGRTGQANTLNSLKELKSHGVEVWSTKQGTLDNDLLAGIWSYFAEEERQRIHARTAPAKRKKRNAGLWVSGTIPYGHLRGDGMTLKQCPVQAPILRQIYEWMIEGLGRIQIVRRLNKNNTPPPFAWFYELDAKGNRLKNSKGNDKTARFRFNQIGGWNGYDKKCQDPLLEEKYRSTWSEGSLSSLVKKTINKGHHEDGTKITISPSPIVSAQTWKEAINASTGRFLKGKGEIKKRLLSGIIKCGTCGHAYYGHYGGGSSRCDYYQCRGRAAENGCKSPATSMQKTDGNVLHGVNYYLSSRLGEKTIIDQLLHTDHRTLVELQEQLGIHEPTLSELDENLTKVSNYITERVIGGASGPALEKLEEQQQELSDKTATLRDTIEGIHTEIQDAQRELFKSKDEAIELSKMACNFLPLLWDFFEEDEVIKYPTREVLQVLLYNVRAMPDKTVTFEINKTDDAITKVIRILSEAAKKTKDRTDALEITRGFRKPKPSPELDKFLEGYVERHQLQKPKLDDM